jgi:hypothetical protein
MPQHLRQSELVGGNAVDAGTFLAILIGTIAGARASTVARRTRPFPTRAW